MLFFFNNLSILFPLHSSKDIKFSDITCNRSISVSEYLISILSLSTCSITSNTSPLWYAWCVPLGHFLLVLALFLLPLLSFYSSQKSGSPDGESLETNHIVPSLHFTLMSLCSYSTPSSYARWRSIALLLTPVRILSVPSIGSQFGCAFQAWYLYCVFLIPFWFYLFNKVPTIVLLLIG